MCVGFDIQRQKTGENWACSEPGCNKVFTKLSKLKVHAMQHTGERPFKVGDKISLRFHVLLINCLNATHTHAHVQHTGGENSHIQANLEATNYFIRANRSHVGGTVASLINIKYFKLTYYSLC